MTVPSARHTTYRVLPKTRTCHVTAKTPLFGVLHRLEIRTQLTMIQLHNEFELPSFIRLKDRTGAKKLTRSSAIAGGPRDAIRQ